MFDIIRNTKPEIIVSIGTAYLDHVGDETPARFVELSWQWHDEQGNWASLEALGAIDDAPDGNFDMRTLGYSFDDASFRFSDDSLDGNTDLQDLMVERACKFNLLHDGYTLEIA